MRLQERPQFWGAGGLRKDQNPQILKRIQFIAIYIKDQVTIFSYRGARQAGETRVSWLTAASWLSMGSRKSGFTFHACKETTLSKDQVLHLTELGPTPCGATRCPPGSPDMGAQKVDTEMPGRG